MIEYIVLAILVLMSIIKFALIVITWVEVRKIRRRMDV